MPKVEWDMRDRCIGLALVLVLAAPAFAENPTAADSPKANLDALSASLKGADAAAKKSAITACAKTPHAAIAVTLSPVMSKESDDLRITAAKTLGAMKGIPEAVKVLHGALAANGRKPAVASAVCNALAKHADVSSVDTLKRFALDALYSKDEEMGAAIRDAMSALGSIRHKNSVEALIAFRAKSSKAREGVVEKTRLAADGGAAAAQEQLVGSSGANAADFETWWKRNAYTLHDDLTKRPVGMRRSRDGW
jgi:hypothetical protein